jgi:antimicrobial peptide system SdpB family protein
VLTERAERLARVVSKMVSVRDAFGRPTAWARSILALSMAATLTATDEAYLFARAVGREDPPNCGGPARFGLFCLMREELGAARYVSIIILLVVTSGYRPRFTGLLHWYVAASLFTSVTVQDGGEEVAAVVTLLLVPITILDPRIWQWNRQPVLTVSRQGVLVVTRYALCLQVAGIYLHAGLAKLASRDWVEGTALYYVAHSKLFGFPDWAKTISQPLLDSEVMLPLLTWGVICLEIALGLAILLPRRAQFVLLCAGIGFHLSIGLLLGIPSFGLAMVAALLLSLGWLSTRAPTHPAPEGAAVAAPTSPIAAMRRKWSKPPQRSSTQ